MLLMLAAGFISIAASQLALGVALLFLLYRWLFRREAPPLTGLEKPAALLAAWALLMIPFSTDVAQSAVYYKRFYLFAAIWVAASCATTEKRRLLMLAFLLAGSVATCLHDQAFHILRTGSLFTERMVGAFNPMTNGCLVMMAVLTGAGFLVAPGVSRRLRWLLALALVPLLVGIIMIMTRSSEMGLLAGLGALFLLVRPRWFAGFALVLALAAVLVAFQGERYLANGPLSRFAPHYLTSDKNTTLRVEMWRGGWNMVKRHPITGVGDRDLAAISPQYYTSADDLYFGHLHSNIPHMAAIWGLPGLVFGQGFILAGLWLLVRRWRALARQPGGAAATPAATGWVLGAIATWAGFYVAGITEWYFGDAESMLVYLAILGTALGWSAKKAPGTHA